MLGTCNAAGYNTFPDITCPQYLCQTSDVQDTPLLPEFTTFKNSACCKTDEEELQGSELYFASCLATEAQLSSTVVSDPDTFGWIFGFNGNLQISRNAYCSVLGQSDACCSLPSDHVGLFSLCQSTKPFLDDSGAEVINLAVSIVDAFQITYLSSPDTVKNDSNFCLNTYFSNLAYNLFNMISQTLLDADPEKRCFDELTDPNFLFYDEQLTK